MSHRNITLEQSIYNFIVDYSSLNGAAPSVREIADVCHCAPSNVQRYLNRLIDEGKIVRNGVRQIRTSFSSGLVVQVPLLGEIACGSPIFATENIETYFPVGSSFLGEGDFFALRAKGDSMVDAGIDDGDIVIIKKDDSPRNGQIVVALIDDEATLKTLRLEKGKIILHPENKNYKDIVLKECDLQGVAVKVIKDIR